MTLTQVRVLQEYSALEYILLGDLCDLLEEPSDKTNSKWLIAILDALLETLPREFDLEEQDGYLAEVRDEHPNWSDKVERLRCEHENLFSKLQTLRDKLVRQASVARMAREVRRELREWIDRLINHEQQETDLMQDAVNLEIGGESG